MAIGKQTQRLANNKKKIIQEGVKMPCGQLLAKQSKDCVTLPCKFGTGFFLHLDRGPLPTVWQVWIAQG